MHECSNLILFIDTNINACEKRKAAWAKYGVLTMRVDTMHRAIVQLMNDDKFLFIAINEDSIPDFMSSLRLMRDVTDRPIIVKTSSYTIEKRIEAIEQGADAYDSFSVESEKNVRFALALLKLKDRWTKHQTEAVPVLLGGDIILSSPRRIVFVKDTEVLLARKEFDILRYLMKNPGNVMRHVQILKKIWGR